ncbi:HNH endonuclease-domain-containing protein [Lipomyces kononenkoae]
MFRARVRDRDRKCVISGTANIGAPRNDWRGFEAAHIFPISSEEHFVKKGLSNCITNRRLGSRETGINSCQNGLLMLSTIHQKFDGFDFSINPDDGYKITCFDGDPFRIDGNVLDPGCRESEGEEGVRDELLKWHFRQTVLANMRGAGEPSFEMDFPPGTDAVGEILSGPDGPKRMEAELFSRFGGARLDGISFV